MDGGVLIDFARRVFVKNFYLKFIALVLTLALYIWVSEDRETVVAEHTSVQTVVPDGMVLVSDPVSRVTVTLRGRWSDIERFDASELDPIRLDLSPEDSGDVISLTPDMVGVPPNLRVTDVEPDSVYIELEREAEKRVALNPRITGEPPAPYTVEDVSVSPDTVLLRGPENRLEEIDSIYTEPVDVTGQTSSMQVQVEPRVDDGLLSAETEEPVVVDVDIETEEITRTLNEVPVEAVNTSYETAVVPSEADVTVRGPRPTIEQMDLELIRLEIDLSDESEQPPGTYSRTPEIVNLPRGVELEEFHPERFRVTTTRPEPPPQEDGEDDPETDSGTMQ